MGSIESIMSADVDQLQTKTSFEDDDRNCKMIFNGFVFTLSMNHRQPFLSFINSIQDEHNCQITKIESYCISKDNYMLVSMTYKKGYHVPFIGISSSCRNNMKQIYICDYWYLNYPNE